MTEEKRESHLRYVTKISQNLKSEYFIIAAISEEKYVDMALSRLRSGRDTDSSQHEAEDEHAEKYDMRTADQEQEKQEEGEEESNLLVTSTVSVPEVSLVPSPEVTKVSLVITRSQGNLATPLRQFTVTSDF